MSKENRTQTLKVEAEEASTHFDAHASQDEASYDGDICDAEEDDIKVVPDEVDGTQIKGLKPVEAVPIADKEVPEGYQQGGWLPNLKVCGQEPSWTTQQQGIIWNPRQSGLLWPGYPCWQSQGKISLGPHFCALHSEGRQSLSYELFWHA